MSRGERNSLLERARGPHAKSVASLIEAADASCAQISESYCLYALPCIEALATKGGMALSKPRDDTSWLSFEMALRDIESSATTAGANWVAAFAGQLASAMEVYGRDSAATGILMSLHVDAIRLAAAGKSTDTDLSALQEKLHRAGEALRG